MTNNPSKIPYRNQLYYRLLVVYFILIVIPILIAMFILYVHLLNLSKQQVLNNSFGTFQTTANLIDNKFYNCRTALHLVSEDAAMHQLGEASNQNRTLIEQFKNSQYLVQMFANVKSSTLISKVQIFLDRNHMLAGEKINFFPLSAVTDSAWYQQLSASESNTIWVDPADSKDTTSQDIAYYSLIRRFYQLDDLGQAAGYIKISLEQNEIDRLMNYLHVTPNSFAALTQNRPLNQSTISPIQISKTSQSTTFDRLLPLVQPQSTAAASWQTVKIDRLSYFVIVQSLQYAPYDFYIIIPYQDIFTQNLPLLLFMFILLLVVSGSAYLLAIQISKSTLHRISNLANSMQQVQSGDLSVRCPVKGADEIATLTAHFNNMVERTNRLIDEKYYLGKELKAQELKALQAQINPHFLYNSLHLINCIAIRHQLPEITNMVNALSKFYKLSLSKGQDMIPLKVELEHVRLYVYIQNMRFQNRIHFSIQCPSEFLDFSIMKTLLQPLVENAIIHGLFEKGSKSGYVAIRVNTQVTATAATDLIIQVIDNGVGISTERLAELFYDNPNSGYGVKNVQLRIQNYYGKDYGLHYASNPKFGAGTIVTLRLPYQSLPTQK